MSYLLLNLGTFGDVGLAEPVSDIQVQWSHQLQFPDPS